MLIAIIGPSGSGKSSLLNKFKDAGYEICPKITSRPKRESEENGSSDYIYESREIIEEYSRNDQLLMLSEYKDWYYGILKESIKKNSNQVIILTPAEYFMLKQNLDIISIYLDIPRRDRLIKILERGDDIDEAYRRNLTDVGQFDQINSHMDIIVKNPEYKKSINGIFLFCKERLECFGYGEILSRN